MKGFGIYVKNDLLEPKHVKSMGNAIWLYLWLLDKMTSVTEEGIGKILGGKPITYDEINEDVPIPVANYRRYITKLRDNGYINTVRTPKGLVITINKAFKPFKKGYIKSDTSKGKVMYQNRSSDVSKSYQGYIKSDTSNIRQYNDNTKTKRDYAKERQKATEIRELLEARGTIKRK